MASRALIRAARWARAAGSRLSDPRSVNPIWVFAAGLGLLLPLWLLFLQP